MTQNVQVSDVLYWINQIDNIDDINYIINKTKDRISEIKKEKQRDLTKEYFNQELVNNIDEFDLDNMQCLHKNIYEAEDNWADYYYNNYEFRKYEAHDCIREALIYIDRLKNVPLEFFIVTVEGKTTFESLIRRTIEILKEF